VFHSYNNINKSDLFITSHKNKLFEHSIAYNGVLIYNKLPHEINPFNVELNAICYLLALLGAHPILHVSRIRVKVLCV